MYNKACEYITGFIYFIGNCIAISYKENNTLLTLLEFAKQTLFCEWVLQSKALSYAIGVL